MSGCYGGFAALGDHRRRTPPPSNGSNRRCQNHRSDQGTSPDGRHTERPLGAFVGRGRGFLDNHTTNAAQPPANQDMVGYTAYYQQTSWNEASHYQPALMSQEDMSPHAPTPYDTTARSGFNPQQQAVPVDWTSHQGTEVDASLTGTFTMGQSEYPVAHRFGQDQLETSYQSSSYLELPPDSLELAAFRYSTQGFDQPQQSILGVQSGSSVDLASPCVDPAQLQLSYPFGSQTGTAPWSTANPRVGDFQSASVEQAPKASSMHRPTLSSTSAAAYSGGDWSSRYSEVPDMSETAFSSDVEDIVNSCITLRDVKERGRAVDQRTNRSVHTEGEMSRNAVAFQYRVEREETPLETPNADKHQGDTSLVYLSPQASVSGPSQQPYSVPSSPSTGSCISITPESEPRVMVCSVDGCGARFTGKYRRGNMGRHVRRQHMGLPGDYLCAHPHCPRTFNRSDSRLKHYRRHHPELAAGPIPRNPQGVDGSLYA